MYVLKRNSNGIEYMTKIYDQVYINHFQGLYGQKYVWFFIGWYEDDWFKNEIQLEKENINCTRKQMETAAEGHFTTEALQWNQDHSKTISGQVIYTYIKN